MELDEGNKADKPKYLKLTKAAKHMAEVDLRIEGMTYLLLLIGCSCIPNPAGLEAMTLTFPLRAERCLDCKPSSTGEHFMILVCSCNLASVRIASSVKR